MDEAEYLADQIRYVGQADSGTTALTYIGNGQAYTGALITASPALVNLLLPNSPHRAATIPLTPAPLPLTVSFPFLWNVDRLVFEAVSSSPAVAELAAPARVTWVRGASPILPLTLNPRTPGTAELTLRVIEGPDFLKPVSLRLTVDGLFVSPADALPAGTSTPARP